MNRRKSNDQFITELKKANDQIVPEEPYVTSSTPISVRCVKCGRVWKSRPNTLLRGYGCPNCAGNIKKTDEKFKKELAAVNADIIPLDSYQGNKTPIVCQCKVCGHKWKAAPNNLLSKNHKCPRCSHERRGKERRKSDEDFRLELSKVNPTIIPLEKYVTSQKRIQCQCAICGHTWKAIPNNLLDKQSRCPNCSHASTSLIEQIMAETFVELLGKDAVLTRTKKVIGKELDIYIPEKEVAIEFGAWYWHKDRLARDEEKRRLCLDKNIKLFTIYEDCPDLYEEKSSKDVLYYSDEISDEKDFHTLKSIIGMLCEEMNLTFDTIEQNWDQIVSRSLAKARRLTEEEFTNKLAEVNETVELIEPFKRYVEKIRCRCKICGNEWSALPSSLLNGHACPKCARKATGIKKTITNDEFLKRLSKINPSVKPLDNYVKGDIPIRCRCKTCGNTWTVKPQNLLMGHGCRVCGRKRTSEKQSRPVRCIETGIVYESISQAQRQTGIFNVHKCANYSQKTAGGYHWEYIDK